MSSASVATASPLFGPSMLPPAASGKAVARLADVESGALRRIAGARGRQTLEGVPLADGSTRTFDVEHIEVFSPDAKILAFDGKVERPLPKPDVVMFEGTERGGRHRVVFSIVNGRDVHAVVFDGEKTTTVIHPYSAAAGRHAIVDATSEGAPDGPLCGGAIEPDAGATGEAVEMHQAETEGFIAGPVLAVEAIIDVGYDLYQYHGSSTAAAAAYATNVVGASSAIYRRDMNVVVLVKQLVVWTAADPFELSTTDAQLTAYRSWSKSNRSGVARDFSHLFKRSSSMGGIAYLSNVCSTDYGYAVSNLEGWYTSFPTAGYQWDIKVVTHETGHVLGSRHTHCYSPPLDRCYNESGCYSGPVVVSVGEIMSYCHLYYSAELAFRPVVASTIRTFADSRTCVGNAPGTCGNAVLDDGEQCDDGNVTSGDGCDLTCVIEQCWTCAGSPSICAAKPDGTACADFDRCTFQTSCEAGECVAHHIGCVAESVQKISDVAGNFTGTLANGNQFGMAVAGIGDLDQDGVPDVAVGASLDDQAGTDAGAIWILFLQADGTVKSHVKITENTSGFTGSLVASDSFGIGVASIGDLDDDGVTDLAVGASLIDDGGTNRGGVFILFMNSDGTVRANQRISSTAGTLTATLAASDFFGSGVAGVGDLDEDGVEDIVVGAPGDDNANGSAAGAMHVLFLRTNGTVKGHASMFGPEADAQLGFAVTSLGDLDGDGEPELAGGMHTLDEVETNDGGVAIFPMQPGGVPGTASYITAARGDFPAALLDNDNFGRGVCGIPDIDGNGAGEIAVGAINDDDGGLDRGAVYQLEIDENALVVRSRKISSLFDGIPPEALSDDDNFGMSISVIGDLDGRGQHELVVGAPFDDDGGSNRGAVYVLFRDGCGGGRLTAGEECDDQNRVDGDGCTATCAIETGWQCTGEQPSWCTPIRGDGRIVGEEECDDGNQANGDGCSSNGVVEPGYACTGEPSDCELTCSNGSLDAGEECDDGNNAAGDCCSPACTLDASGASCDLDGNECTTDTCDGAGTCNSVARTGPCEDGNLCTEPDTCVDGVCVSGEPVDCSDDSLCTTEWCDESLGCRVVAQPQAETSCLTATKMSLQLKGGSDSAKYSMKWKWAGGADLQQAALGSPNADTTYSLCVFDTTSSVPSLEMTLDVPASAFWKSAAPKGFSYSDRTGSAEGVQKIRLKTGSTGRSSAQLKGGKSSLPIAAPYDDTTFFDQNPNVVVQLLSSSGLCLTSTFPESSTKSNDALHFKAVLP